MYREVFDIWVGLSVLYVNDIKCFDISKIATKHFYFSNCLIKSILFIWNNGVFWVCTAKYAKMTSNWPEIILKQIAFVVDFAYIFQMVHVQILFLSYILIHSFMQWKINVHLLYRNMSNVWKIISVKCSLILAIKELCCTWH